MSTTAEKVHVWVHREADGYLLAVSSQPLDLSPLEGDIVTEQDVWIEVVS